LQWLKKLGEDKSWNEAVSKALGIWQDLLIGIVNYIKQVIQGFKDIAGWASSVAGAAKSSGHMHAASGGFFATGSVVDVGESGRETMVVGAGGTMVIPGGGGSTGGGSTSAGGGVHYHFHIGTMISTAHARDQFMNELLRGGRHRPGT